MHILHDNYTVGENGHLYVGGCDTVALAEKYGTPLYVVDEDKLRSNMQRFSALLRECFPAGSRVLFASKALSYVDVYRIASSEGIGADVVSPGELYTACKAGFNTKDIYFHGNNKTDADIAYALDVGVGTFVVDNEDELLALDRIAGAHGKVQDILLRISPGIDPHTHKKVVTGSVDSKFGTAIETGQAMALVERALALSGVRLKGFHCHIGSQIFDSAPFIEAAEVMLAFIADVYRKTGFLAEYLNLGGGYGVSYTEATADLDAARVLREIGDKVRAFAASHGIAVPQILIEPGRAIVAAAGVTLYTVGSHKTITGYRTYVSVDGGMPDNPRYALYQSDYTALIASRAAEEKTERVTIAGRCCESGDLIQENAPLQPCGRGDVLAVLVTGAYNYSMASNYNRLPRPAMVSVRDGADRLVIRRESYEDLTRNEL